MTANIKQNTKMHIVTQSERDKMQHNFIQTRSLHWCIIYVIAEYAMV